MIPSPQRLKLYEEIESQIGTTPLHRISRIEIPNGNRIYGKEEYRNPTESVFDRLYPFLLEWLKREVLLNQV